LLVGKPYTREDETVVKPTGRENTTRAVPLESRIGATPPRPHGVRSGDTLLVGKPRQEPNGRIVHPAAGRHSGHRATPASSRFGEPLLPATIGFEEVSGPSLAGPKAAPTQSSAAPPGGREKGLGRSLEGPGGGRNIGE
jgi:hypothetical protein